MPARDAAGTLGTLLESLESQSVGRRSFEVIVVDNGSRDRTSEVASAGGATVVGLADANRSLARNAGAGRARGKVLAFTDADCVAAPEWLEELIVGLAQADLAAGPIQPVLNQPPNAVERFEALWRFRQEEYVRSSGWAPTGNLAVTAQAFERLGGFDPSMRIGGEDVELGLRAREAGMRLAWRPLAAVTHPAERSLGGLLRRGARHGFAAAHHVRRTGGDYGTRYWRHPGPALRGDWALRRFGVEAGDLPAGESRRMLRLARAEYLARMAGSLAAELRRVR